MFQAIRRYCSILTLILMSVVCVSIVVDEYGDPQQLVKQTAATSGMEVIADDFDCDEDEEDGMVSVSFVEDHSTPLPAPILKGQKSAKSRCSKALLRGQTRRYSPRNNLPNSLNYVILRDLKSGMELFHTTFFSYTLLLTKLIINNEKT